MTSSDADFSPVRRRRRNSYVQGFTVPNVTMLEAGPPETRQSENPVANVTISDAKPALKKTSCSEEHSPRNTWRWSELIAILMTPFPAPCLQNESMSMSVHMQQRFLGVWYTRDIFQYLSQPFNGFTYSPASVTMVLQAVNISFSRRAHVFLTKDDVIHICDLEWLRATVQHMRDLGMSNTATALDECSAAGHDRQSGFGAALFSKDAARD